MNDSFGVLLSHEFALAGRHAPVIRHYFMESTIKTMAPDGTVIHRDRYRLTLTCTPAAIGHTPGDTYTCRKFTLQLDDAPEVFIPILDHWSYVYHINPDYRDQNGRVLGIDHRPFEDLKDSQGRPIPPEKAYHVYNAFIDFHALCSVFSEKTPTGTGIQDLTHVGQKIIHAAAFSKAPVNLGSVVEPGSYFTNGEVTLEFKGLGLYHDAPCAIVGYDSGSSSFAMRVTATPGVVVPTTGSSHYKGDIYKNLNTNWVEKADLDEVVVSETVLPGPPHKISAVSERHIVIRSVGQDEA